MVHAGITYAPTALFRVEENVYGRCYYPLNDLAIDLARAFERPCISEAGLAALKRTGITVEVRV